MLLEAAHSVSTEHNELMGRKGRKTVMGSERGGSLRNAHDNDFSTYFLKVVEIYSDKRLRLYVLPGFSLIPCVRSG